VPGPAAIAVNPPRRPVRRRFYTSMDTGERTDKGCAVVATDQQAGAAASSASATPSAETSTPGLLGQLVRFVLIGGFCAVVDLGIYWLGLQAGLWVHLAKAIGFIFGTTTAYFLNRKFTFNGGVRGGAGQLGGFVLLYTVTFFVNVGTNALMLSLLPESKLEYGIAWFVAQATATTINFVMLKWVVFREPPIEPAA